MESVSLVKSLQQLREGILTNSRYKGLISRQQLRGLVLSESVEFVQDSHSAAVNSLSIDREESRYLLCGLGDGTLALHNIFGTRKRNGYTSKVELRIGRNSPFKHSHAIQTVSWYRDNGMFISSGRDGKVKAWDTNQGCVVEQFTVGRTINKHAIGDVEVGALVAVANDTNHAQLVDLNTGSTCHALRGHSGEVLTCAWSTSNPRVLATGAADNKVILWDVRQAQSFLASLDYNNVRFKRDKDIKLAGSSHQSSVHGLLFSACGRYLYSVGKDKRIRKWDTVTFKNLKTKFPEVNVKCKGSLDLASTGSQGTEYLFVPEENNVAVLDTETGGRLPSLVGHYSGVNCLEYSEDRLGLLSGARDRFILHWEIPLQNTAARADKLDGDGKDINPYTVDAWSSDEEDT